MPLSVNLEAIALKRSPPPRRKKQLQSKTGLKPGKGLARGDNTLARTSPLAKVGRRGRRLRKEDRKEERISHALPCVCGCNAGPGEVARAHLERRGIETTRNVEANNLPACWYMGEWLDHTPEGVNAKRSLWALAIGLGRRLEPEDVQSIIRTAGYYEWRAKADGRGAQTAD